MQVSIWVDSWEENGSIWHRQRKEYQKLVLEYANWAMKICLFGEMEDPQITWSGEGWNPNEQWGIQQEYKTIVIYKSPLIPSQPISIYLPRGTAKPIYPTTTTISHFA